VPVSQLAYSNLPKHKNNKASSLTNLSEIRRKFWDCVVTTVLARERNTIKAYGGAQYAIRSGYQSYSAI